MSEGAWLAVGGAAAGVVAAAALTRLLAGMLYETGAFDPTTFIAVAFGLVSVAILASYLPARRASRVDPMVTLRSE